MVEPVGIVGADGFTYIICTFGNVCTVEIDGMCPECVQHFELFNDDYRE